MNRLPWARLMTPMTPKISVRPLLMRNSSSPYWTPLRSCAMSPVMPVRFLAAGSGGAHLAAGAGVGQRLGRDADHHVLTALRLAQVDVLHRVVAGREGEGAARAVDAR